MTRVRFFSHQKVCGPLDEQVNNFLQVLELQHPGFEVIDVKITGTSDSPDHAAALLIYRVKDEEQADGAG